MFRANFEIDEMTYLRNLRLANVRKIPLKVCKISSEKVREILPFAKVKFTHHKIKNVIHQFQGLQKKLFEN